MLDGKQRHDWSIASAVMAVMANLHRDPRRSRRLHPSEFDPFARRKRHIKADITVLKDVFINNRMPHVVTEQIP